MSDYEALISEVADLARRIGPARRPEEIRDRLEDIVARHRRWAESARTPGPTARTNLSDGNLPRDGSTRIRDEGE